MGCFNSVPKPALAKPASQTPQQTHIKDRRSFLLLKPNYQEIASRMTAQHADKYWINGFSNTNNVCFIISALQCILRIQPLVDYFLSQLYKEDMDKNLSPEEKDFLETIHSLVSAYFSKSHQVLDLGKFSRCYERIFPGYEVGSQEDIQEFLAFFLQKIHCSLNRNRQRGPLAESPDGHNAKSPAELAWKRYLRTDKSIIVDIFQGQLMASLRCLSCKAERFVFEPLMYLSIPLTVKTHNSSDYLTTEILLSQCVDAYFTPEKLQSVHCDSCGRSAGVEKSESIVRAPNILVLHIKRFKFERGELSKQHYMVRFPVDSLELGGFAADKGSAQYSLFAVAFHSGEADFGHYYSAARDSLSSHWHLFDDEVCSTVDTQLFEEEQAMRDVYLLFYVKRNIKAFSRQSLRKFF